MFSDMINLSYRAILGHFMLRASINPPRNFSWSVSARCL